MATRQQAINAKCRDCIYDAAQPGNWKQQVGNCAITQCALWQYRPRSRPKKQRAETQQPDPLPSPI